MTRSSSRFVVQIAMKASDIFVAALEQEGVEFVFGIPGEENLDILDSLSRSSIRLILTRHEQAAGFMAATYGRLTGKAGVCLATLGPGACNLVTAAAYAQLGGMPMVMLTGQKPIRSSKQGQFQILDVVDMMTPLTKYTRQIASGDNVPANVREAFRQAQEEKPGAVHLELPEDVARDTTSAALIPASYVRRPIAEAKAISAAVNKLTAATCPILVVGAGANRKTTCKALRSFVDRFKIPFVTTQMGKGVIGEEHPLFLGNAALSSGDFVHRAIEAADLIVNVGHDIVEKPPFLMHPGSVEVLHVNFSSAVVDAVYFPQVEVVGDIGNAIWQIGEVLVPQEHWDFSRLIPFRDAAREHIQKRSDDPRFPMLPQRVVADLRRTLTPNDIITLDNGIYKIWFARNYPAASPNTVLLDNALATMGAGLPSAMAAKLVHPDRAVVAVCGDGGFMMNSQELETSTRLGLHIVLIVLRDNAYGMIKWKQAHMGLDDYGLDYGNPDFVRYAESYGAVGHRPKSAEEFIPILERALAEPGVHLIDVAVDYSENDRILNREIQEQAAAIG